MADKKREQPWYLGPLGLSFAVPMVVVPRLGGVVVDRVDRVRLLYITQTGALLAAVLAIVTWSGLVRPWHILLTTFAGALLLAILVLCASTFIRVRAPSRERGDKQTATAQSR